HERFARTSRSAFRLPSPPAADGARARDRLAQAARKSGARGIAPGAGSRAWQHQPRRAQARRRPQHALPENASVAHQVAGQEAAALTPQGGDGRPKKNGAETAPLLLSDRRPRARPAACGPSEKENGAQGDDAVLVFTSGLVLGRRLNVFT